LAGLDISLDEVDDDLIKFQQDARVKSALSAGVDLRQYSSQITNELVEAEFACVNDYVTSSTELKSLHLQLQSCDSTLLSMEKMLQHFQSDLSLISGEIQSLQSKSTEMNTKLNNRRSAEIKLGEFIQHCYIPQSLANSIIEGEINENFINNLQILHQRLIFLANFQSQNNSQTKTNKKFPQAISDVSPSLLRLRLKSIQRIRIFLFEKFHALQKPKTNIQIKQKLLIKYRTLYEFLLNQTDLSLVSSTSSLSLLLQSLKHKDIPHLEIDIANEIRSYYHTVLSHIYTNKFKQYLNSLTNLQSPNPVAQSDLLGSEESYSRVGMTGFFTSKRTPTEILKSFILGEKILFLAESIHYEMVIPHIAEKEGKHFPFERLFASSQALLMDTATSEYDFIVEFFGERIKSEGDRAGLTEDAVLNDKLQSSLIINRSQSSGPSLVDDERGRSDLLPSSRDKPLFSAVFNSTINLFLSHLENYLLNCFDVLSILLLIRILCQNNLQMQYRRVHCLDQVFDRMNTILWPKFKLLFDAHVQSVAKLSHCEIKLNSSSNNINGVNNGVKTMTGPSSTINSQPSQSFNFIPYQRPLYVCVRYGYLISAIYLLNKSYRDDILILNIKRLRIEIEKLILRSASRISSPKLQIVFLIHQYQAISAIIKQQITSMNEMTGKQSAHNINNNNNNNNNGLGSRLTSSSASSMLSGRQSSSSSISSASSLLVDNEDLQSFHDLSKHQISLFAEEELGEKFRSLIEFVRRTETAISNEIKLQQSASSQSTALSASSSSSPTSASLNVDLTGLEPIVKQFAKYWRSGIESIATSVRSHFQVDYAPLIDGLPSSMSLISLTDDCCLLIMQTIFVQLLLYYQRLTKIVKEFARNKPNIVKDLVPANTISFEIRKYTDLRER